MGKQTTGAPADSRYFEDYAQGTLFDCGSNAVEQTEIIAVAQRYDPQYFHTDPVAAKRSPFGVLIASGWHTAALALRPLVEGCLLSLGILVSRRRDAVLRIGPRHRAVGS